MGVECRGKMDAQLANYAGLTAMFPAISKEVVGNTEDPGMALAAAGVLEMLAGQNKVVVLVVGVAGSGKGKVCEWLQQHGLQYLALPMLLRAAKGAEAARITSLGKTRVADMPDAVVAWVVAEALGMVGEGMDRLRGLASAVVGDRGAVNAATEMAKCVYEASSGTDIEGTDSSSSTLQSDDDDPDSYPTRRITRFEAPILRSTF